ncbi:coenzyme PQQ synthesis protein D (PqqD) [Chitinophaga dinghuensis]|uniref:Coenzyme PQQ synthesis protein D (PqqD) n=1 Tax=Chitinophaga dinghuensis TaxID=1539050 RepID=A0A327VRG1_9BACT|nr:PqqD family protein [Chitinophaga dinghuensis]RAJ76669.1 coenzyme PQQ synthesis protein D (PqqD) [Chitinophaga dinghuensis]
MTFLEEKIALSESCIVREMGDGFVILNLSTERFYELKEVGKRFWELISENKEYTLTLNILQEEYDVTAEQLRKDISRLTEDLKKAGLIVNC